MPSQFKIQQWEKYEGEDWWNWAVWLEAPAEDLDRVEFVEWTLHPSFPNPIRKSDDRANNFRIETGGWGVFQILARVQLKAGEQVKLQGYLRLHYPDGTQTTA